MGEIKPDRFYEALEVQNGRLLAEIARLQAERDAAQAVCRELVSLWADGWSQTRLRRCVDAAAAALATSSPSASGPS